MANEEQLKKIPVMEILRDSFLFWKEKQKAMLLFSLAVMFLSGSFFVAGGVSESWFLLWLAVFYLFWFFFFRYVFERRPYLFSGEFFTSLIPSIKVFFLVLLVLSVLYFIPFIPLFMEVPIEVKDNYTAFLQRYMQDSSVVDIVLYAVLFLASPLFFFRPLLAWIAAITGRSWAISTAWNKTRGNYGAMLALMLVLALPPLAVFCVFGYLLWPLWLAAIILSPLFVFGGIVFSRVYKLLYSF